MSSLWTRFFRTWSAWLVRSPSRLTSIYTIYCLLSTTSGLGVRHTGPIGRFKPSAGGRTVGIAGKSLWAVCKVLSLPDCNTTRQAMRDRPYQVPSMSFRKPRPSRGVHDRTQFVRIRIKSTNTFHACFLHMSMKEFGRLSAPLPKS